VGEAGRGGRDPGGEVRLVQHQPGFGVGQQVLELLDRVAHVDVHGHGPQLQRGQHRLEVLGAVAHGQRHSVARPDAPVDHDVGQAVGALVELAEGPPAAGGHDGLSSTDLVHNGLEQIGQVPWPHAATTVAVRPPWARTVGTATRGSETAPGRPLVPRSVGTVNGNERDQTRRTAHG
jgi:hypothetical protein